MNPSDDEASTLVDADEEAASDDTASVPPPGVPGANGFLRAHDVLPWAHLGRFELADELGRGAMGRVVEASDPELRRRVAIKLLAGVHAPERVQRFVSEARITGQLDHPNIPPVYDLGTNADGQIYFVMKKVVGQSLRDLLKPGRESARARLELQAEWPRHRMLSIFAQVCNGVAYAHDRGVLHRDLKPANIMLGDFGEVLVMDWGLARLSGDPSTEQPLAVDTGHSFGTMEGSALGTPGYMAPEQARGELLRLGPATDVWSLGAILYEILTWQKAFDAPSVLALLEVAARSKPVDPRERSPELRVPDELVEICAKAMQPEPEDRFSTAVELAEAVRFFLEGTRRRQRASRLVRAAEQQWRRWQELEEESRALAAEIRSLEESVEPWAPLADKAALLGKRERLAELVPERAGIFAKVVGGCERGLSHAPGHAGARELLARAYFQRFLEAEARSDLSGLRFYAERVREYHDHADQELLRGRGRLTLTTDPPGAAVTLQRFDQRGLLWPLSAPEPGRRTPLDELELDMGSYLLRLRREGFVDVVYPVLVERNRGWHTGKRPLPLLRADEIGEGFVYVPGGRTRFGGDPDARRPRAAGEAQVDGFLIAELPVTNAEYCTYLTALAEQDPEEAWERAPRLGSGMKGSGGQFWERPAPGQPYEPPERDADGDRWDGQWPVVAISWDDAHAYAAWAGARDGRAYRLPTELEWSKAARGVDGRPFPWGDTFDAALCKTEASRAGRATPEPVGAFPTDRSVYGVRDLAGSVREWCGDLAFDGDATRRPVRGGTWGGGEEFSRLASRSAYLPWSTFTDVGLRLVCPLPEDAR